MLKKKQSYTVAVLGATGAVGKESLEILEERNFPIGALRLFSSKRSAGEVSRRRRPTTSRGALSLA